MSNRQRGQTEDAAGRPVSGPSKASDWNSFYRATRMTRLAQTKPGDDSLSAHQTANGLFFYFTLVDFFYFFFPRLWCITGLQTAANVMTPASQTDEHLPKGAKKNYKGGGEWADEQSEQRNDALPVNIKHHNTASWH